MKVTIERQARQSRSPRLRISRRAALNVLILASIALIYALVMFPAVHTALASAGPSYRGVAENVIALECVVNWDASALAPNLDMLREKGARITFFVSADWALRNPALLQRMAAEGHEIGCYGSIVSGDRNAFRKDIQLAREAIRLQSGVTPRLYMPAADEVPADCIKALHDEKMLCVLYSLDIQTARATEPNELVDRALSNPFGGELIRFFPTALAQRALPDIVDKLRENGFMLKPVGEVLGTRIL